MADPWDKTVLEALHAWRVQYGAGISLADSLRTSAPICALDSNKACFINAADRAASGGDMETLLDALSPLLSRSERTAITVGWSSGRFESVMDSVLAQRELWMRARARIRSRMVLPLAVLLIASIVAPLPSLFLGGSVIGYAFAVLEPLVAAFLLISVIGKMLRARSKSRDAGDGIAPPDSLDRVMLNTPILRDLERERNLGEFAALLSILIGAGVNITKGMELCSRALINGYYRREVEIVSKGVSKGNPISKAMTNSAFWPREFVTAIDIGERSGALENVLKRLAEAAQERYCRAIETLADWIPRLGYALVALFIIFNIFKMVVIVAGFYKI